MRTVLRCLLCLLLLGGAAGVRAEVVVVVDARAGVESVSRDEVISIFLGRRRVLPNGQEAFPIDLAGNAELQASFYRKLVDKSLAEISAYWARLHFSGKTRAPARVTSNAEVVSYVLGVPGGIAYLPREQVDGRLRVILTLP